MNKPELLSPAGDFKSLEMAIQAGCDAVYIALKQFGARAYAPNFSNDEVLEAIKLCHLYGVKLYVAMNTLVKDSEVDDFIESVKFLYTNGIDAIIMQDFGMICLCRKMFPDLEIHASTQFNNSSNDTLELLNSLGVKRAVLSRELSLDEIKSMNVDIEKEVFIHGALCISYSGCCFMSKMMGNRSANRGSCTGCCRLPYKLETDGQVVDSGYLLSTKELNTARRALDLINSGVDSLKIEGRMKSSTYVYFITRFYRNLIDNYDKVDIDKEEEKLKILFNREFTEGHLFNVTDKNILNTLSPNHIGLKAGKVINISKKYIKIKLNYPIYQEDGIRFFNSKRGLTVNFLYDKNMKLCNKCSDICYVLNKIDLKKLDDVYITSSKHLEDEVMLYDKRKIGIKISAHIHINKKLEVSISDCNNTITLYGNVVSDAINSPTSSDKIYNQLSRVKDSVYKIDEINIDMDDNVFVPIKELNGIRRELISKLNEARTKVSLKKINPVSFDILDITPTSYTSILVNDEDTFLNVVNKYNRIYISDIDIFNKYKAKYMNIYYSERRNLLNRYTTCRNLVHDISYPIGQDDICSYSFNVFNRYSVYFLHKIGYKCVSLSVELDYLDIINLRDSFYKTFKFYPNIEVFSKGRVLNMIIRGNIFDNYNNLYLIDYKSRRFPIKNIDSYTYIYNYIIFDKYLFYRTNLSKVNLFIDTTFCKI